MATDETVSTSTVAPVDSLPPQHATSLNAWCSEVLTLRAVAKSFTDQADAIVEEKVLPLVKALGLESSVAGDGWTLVSSKGRTMLKASLLLQNGVSMDVIERSKETGKPSWGVRANKGGASDGEAGEVAK